MNRHTYLLFVVFILLVTQINVFAQTDQVALDTSVTDGSSFFNVRLRSDSLDSSVVQGPSTWGFYSYVNYTHPNIWLYIEGWDLD